MNQLISNVLMQPKPTDAVERQMTLVEKLENFRDTQTDYEATLADAVIDSCIDIVEGHSDWVSVDERLPSDAGRYICAIAWHNVTGLITMDAIYFDERHGFDAGESKSVTHWMPIPQPPSEVQDD